MTSLPTVPITQTSEGMAPTTSDKSKYQSSSMSHPSTGGPAVDMGPYQKSPLSNPLVNNPALDLNVHHPPGAQPPQLLTPLASEPAEQWASSTIHAVTDDNLASNASTPGLEVPGAYPSLLPSKETVQQDLEYARGVAASALSTASGYATAAGNTVVTAVTSAKQPATHAAQTVGSGVAVAGQATADTATAVGSSGVDAGNTLASGAVSAGQTTAEVSRSAGQSASSGVSAAPHTVVSTMKAAGATAASYLPPAIASYLPGFSSGGNQTISHSTAITDPTGNAINGLEGLHGTSFAKLPEETRVANEFHYNTTAVADPTGNAMNGLEGLSGQSLAKLPEERVEEAEPIPYASERRSKTFSASYLNPVVVPDSGVHSSRNAPEATANAPSTHQPMLPSDSKFQTLRLPTLQALLLKQTLNKDPNPHSVYHENDAHRGTFENKPLHESVRSKVDPHIETLRQHDC
ncbi:hypothetical protein FA13DRAFT_1800891 [Coprinellus micaceus]|uniref:Uncharacterized protein n=1 Tax=Coprinellus micaceus TaxID=71717 RepID=A0A4Y7SF45_COPMI|nr:hypothetical protein FA13DRAFT_1800891 [Coprinellus micaceus]